MIPVPRTYPNRLVHQMHLCRQRRRGVRFPRAMFLDGTLHHRIATIDEAYDLACEVLGTTWVDMHIERDGVRFMPHLIDL